MGVGSVVGGQGQGVLRVAAPVGVRRGKDERRLAARERRVRVRRRNLPYGQVDVHAPAAVRPEAAPVLEQHLHAAHLPSQG